MTAQLNTQGGLSAKIGRHTAKVGVVGLGYVGLPTIVAAATTGFTTVGLDIDQNRVDQINAGNSYIEDIQSPTLTVLIEQGNLSATTDFGVLGDMDIIVICVPTPVNSHNEPELTALQDAVHTLAKYMDGEQLVVLQSTTYPGTTEEMVLPKLQATGREVGNDFYLAFSPERIDPGNRQYRIHNIPKVVGGVTPRCADMAVAFFSTFVEQVIRVGSPKVAEMTKLLENIFRSVNIALVNELAQLCSRMDVDIWELIHAASTKPFGFMPFYPGVGVGGHCIPVDPFYLAWKAKEYDFYPNFIEVAARTNDNMPHYAVSRIAAILSERDRPITDCNLLLLGISFKKDIGDTRNSPALRVAELLAEMGATVSYSDPHVPEVTIGGRTLTSLDLNKAAFNRPDATIILVDHSLYDMVNVVNHSRLVIDTRDATRSLVATENVVKL